MKLAPCTHILSVATLVAICKASSSPMHQQVWSLPSSATCEISKLDISSSPAPSLLPAAFDGACQTRTPLKLSHFDSTHQLFKRAPMIKATESSSSKPLNSNKGSEVVYDERYAANLKKFEKINWVRKDSSHPKNKNAVKVSESSKQGFQELNNLVEARNKKDDLPPKIKESFLEYLWKGGSPKQKEMK